MSLLDRFHNTSPDQGDAASGDPNAVGLPIPGYDGLKPKEVVDSLRGLTQVELEAVEAFERSHDERPAVLDKLRYMRSSEPVRGYDGLSPDQISNELEGADAERVKAIRDYERKFKHRQQVLDDAASALPAAPASAREIQAREAKAARVMASTRSSPGEPQG